MNTSLDLEARNPSSEFNQMQSIKKLKETINKKTTEIEKAKMELTLGEKQNKYKQYCEEQKHLLEDKKERTIEKLEDRSGWKKERCREEITKLERRKEILHEEYLRKVQAIDEEIEQLQRKEHKAIEKIDAQKNQAEEERLKKIAYYDTELRKLEENLSSPKVRSLDIDLINLWEELNQKEKVYFEEPCSIKGWKRYLPQQIRDPSEPIIIEPKLPPPPPVPVADPDRGKLSDKKGCLILDDDTSDDEPVKKPISISSASQFGKIIHNTKRQSSK
jgi:hypothetical protein